MQLKNRLVLFALFLAVTAAFVWLSSKQLPAQVASHFGADGTANGFMSRGSYLTFMLAFVIGLPALLVGLTSFFISNTDATINIPNNDYWLAPERRADTVTSLRDLLYWFSALLVILLCYVHWLVVLANEANPAKLNSAGFFFGMLCFLIALFFWLRLFNNRFQKPT